jgi:RimJ/RimL family protein N-acetyltransferase
MGEPLGGALGGRNRQRLGDNERQHQRGLRTGVHRVVIDAASANLRSRRIPERLGFTREGVLREAGRGPCGYQDLVVYGLLDREWRRR